MRNLFKTFVETVVDSRTNFANTTCSELFAYILRLVNYVVVNFDIEKNENSMNY